MARKPKKPLKNKNKIKNQDKLAVDKQKIPRHREKYAALNFKRQVKTRLDQLETDYLDKLSEKDKAWLNAFLEETVITNFQHKGKKFNKTKKSKKPYYDANNARNRCMYTRAKAMGTIISTSNPNALQAIIDDNNNADSINSEEDYMLALIELKRKGIIEET